MKKIVMIIALGALSLAPALNAGNEQNPTQPSRFQKVLSKLSRPGHFCYGTLKLAIASASVLGILSIWNARNVLRENVLRENALRANALRENALGEDAFRESALRVAGARKKKSGETNDNSDTTLITLASTVALLWGGCVAGYSMLGSFGKALSRAA